MLSHRNVEELNRFVFWRNVPNPCETRFVADPPEGRRTGSNPLIKIFFFYPRVLYEIFRLIPAVRFAVSVMRRCCDGATSSSAGWCARPCRSRCSCCWFLAPPRWFPSSTRSSTAWSPTTSRGASTRCSVTPADRRPSNRARSRCGETLPLPPIATINHRTVRRNHRRRGFVDRGPVANRRFRKHIRISSNPYHLFCLLNYPLMSRNIVESHRIDTIVIIFLFFPLSNCFSTRYCCRVPSR